MSEFDMQVDKSDSETCTDDDEDNDYTHSLQSMNNQELVAGMKEKYGGMAYLGDSSEISKKGLQENDTYWYNTPNLYPNLDSPKSRRLTVTRLDPCAFKVLRFNKTGPYTFRR
jgi:hypothetical protein